jgi:hypothetical protein
MRIVETGGVTMRIKSLVGALALTTAFAVSPLAQIEAATLGHPGSQPAAASLTQLVQAKEKKAKSHKAMRHHRKHKSAKHAKGKGPGGCGTNMYYSRKAGKCLDARAKK